MSWVGDRIAARAASLGKPVPAMGGTPAASRDSGSFRDSFSDWEPPQVWTRDQGIFERVLSRDRAADLTANDWAANSGINAICTNAVGTGLKPQSRVDYKRLGITQDQAAQLQGDIEAVWNDWAPRAHVRRQLTFDDLQFLGLRSMLRVGELVFLPVMRPCHGSPVELAIQDIPPARLRTPADKMTEGNIVDGVEMDKFGAPVAYWIATPESDSGLFYDSAYSSDRFTRIPAYIGHRPGCFHLFRSLEEEQVRGQSILSPGMVLFKNLSDSISNELLAQVITSSLAMFIAQEPGTGLPDLSEKRDKNKHYYQEIPTGGVMYGNAGEKPQMLESSRPSPNWASFCEFVLRSMAASIDMPYEILAKDFSKTNYSSARAALIEAWRVFMLYRQWLVRRFCAPVWGMVIEEAWLNGTLKLPAGAPDFYDAVSAYCRANWIGPSRGYVDPVKETSATKMAVDNGFMTRHEAIAERGRDYDEVMDELEGEKEREKDLGLAVTAAPAPAAPAPEGTEEGNDEEKAD